jgi:hypothetical protein
MVYVVLLRWISLAATAAWLLLTTSSSLAA